MRIVLATLNAKFIHASLALRCLRAYAKRDFPDIHLREFTTKDPAERVLADLFSVQPDVVALSVYIWNVEETVPLIRMLKQVMPQVKIVLGGPEVTYDTGWWMERLPDVDAIVQGEGEATFHALLSAWRDGSDLAAVNGVMYRDLRGVHQTPPRGKLALESLPSPYEDEDLPALRNRIAYFETSRGCPFSCQFCLSSIESGVRYYPIAYVKSELARLVQAGVRTVKFVDRTFNLNRGYALELFQFLIDLHTDTVFQFEITGDILPPEIVDFLATHAPAGLFRFEIGVQSTNDATNALVKRRQNFEKLSRTIQRIGQAGNIVQHLDLIAGLPEEDYASFQKTFDDVFQFEPDELQLGFLKLLRGTGLRKQADQYGYVFMDQAPYEIFSSRVLPYPDVIKIKQVEDVLEKTWNEGKLRHTVQFLTRHVYDSAFSFFQRFGAFWEDNGWDRIGHQLEDLYLRLNAFLEREMLDQGTDTKPLEENIQRYETAVSWMMVDFLLQHRTRPHRVWWTRVMQKKDRHRLLQWVEAEQTQNGNAAIPITVDHLERHAVLERIPRLVSLDSLCDGDAKPGLLIVHYPPGLKKGEGPTIMTRPMPEGLALGQRDFSPSAV